MSPTKIVKFISSTVEKKANLASKTCTWILSTVPNCQLAIEMVTLMVKRLWKMTGRRRRSTFQNVLGPDTVACICNPSTLGGHGGRIA
ncbi:hypothetical protein AAY473_030923 [Plecturocebus cupreus]